MNMGVWKSSYDNKRKRINLSFNEKDAKKFQVLFNSAPSIKLIKHIIFNKEVIIKTNIVDKSKDELTYQLKKIGNNINQIAWKLNSNSEDFNANEIIKLQTELSNIKDIISKL